jgi:uncharacterized lipoprotein
MRTLVVGLFLTLLVVVNQSNTDPWSTKTTIHEWAQPNTNKVYAASNAKIEGYVTSSLVEVEWVLSDTATSHDVVSRNNKSLLKDIKVVCSELKSRGDNKNFETFCID